MLGGYEIALWILLAIATFTDLRWGKVYNWTTFFFFFTGIAVRLLFEGMEGGLQAFTAIGLATALFFPLWIVGVFAAGDVKLIMAFAAWAHWKAVLDLGLLGIVIGATVGGLILLGQRGFWGSLRSLAAHLRAQNASASLRIAFAPAFLCAYCVLLVAEQYRWELFPI